MSDYEAGMIRFTDQDLEVLFDEAQHMGLLVGDAARDCESWEDVVALATAIDEAAAVGLLESLQVLP